MDAKAKEDLREQLVEALRGTDTQHPLRLAVGRMLEAAVQLETVLVAVGALSAEERQFQGGRLAHALDLAGLWEDVGTEAAQEKEK